MNATDNSSSKPIAGRFTQFFYHEEVPYGLALVRIVLPLILLAVIVPRWFHARELFSSDGAPAPLAINYGINNFPPEPGGALAVALMTALVVTLVTSSLGWFTRPSLVIAFSLYTYLNLLDCLSTMTKYSAISSHLLLILSLSQCGCVWSIDSLTGRDPTRACPIWPQRLMQLLIGLIYLGAAFTKLHTGEFFTSDQLRNWMMTNVNNPNPLGEWLSLHPAVIVAMSHIAIIWQIIFVFVVFKPGFRELTLGLGVMFHFATTPLLGLYVFPLVMTTSYLCYLKATDIQRIDTLLRDARAVRWIERRSSRRSQRLSAASAILTSGAAWSLILLTGTLAGVAAERTLDPYGERSSRGPHQLPVAGDSITVALKTLMSSSGQREIAAEDFILSMDVGCSKIGNVLISHIDHVRANQQFFVQVTLTTPHPDIWLDCRLENEFGQILERLPQIVPRRSLRADWSYRLPDSLPTGIYTLVLAIEQQELARRQIRLVQ